MDIGVEENALYCITDRVECCRHHDGGQSGDWFLPGQTRAIYGGGPESSADFSMSRNPSAVLMHRRNGATSPIGVYRCEVLDSGGVLRSLYIGVYGDGGT